MQDLRLRERLRSFCVEATNQLAHDVSCGEDVPFELVDANEGDANSQPLWCYRTQTEEFVRRRIGVIGMLPGYRPAAAALEEIDGLDEWLLSRGEQHIPAGARNRADAVLRVYLTEVLGETTTFEFDEARFEATWATLDGLLFEGRTVALLAVPVHGVELESDELRLSDGTLLVTNRSADAESLPADIFRSEGLPLVIAMIELEAPTTKALADARQQLRKLLCTMRISADSNPALGGAGRLRVAGGTWQVVGLDGSGSARGTLPITRDCEAEFTEFHSIVARRWPSGGELAWALRRHEFGCDRVHRFDALSDHLLALRALLEPEGPASGRLSQRLAALCALPEEQAQLAERIARAAALEHGIVTGMSAREREAEHLCAEVEHHLRGLLRDVLSNHLDSDLCRVADAILAKAAGVEELPGEKRRFGWGQSDSMAA